MRYVETSLGSAYLPKLLGIYERELAAAIDAVCARRPRLIIDVGAAEGYYAVGLALRNPQARVVAFEMDPRGRETLRHMANLNGVTGRVEVRGRCEPQDLNAALGATDDPVLVCDVEGDEELLLDPDLVPDLRRAAILVETHDFVRAGITETLQRRFQRSHGIEPIWQEPRSRHEFPWRTLGTVLLPGSYLEWAVNEWRPVRMCWLWMDPGKRRKP
jgi:hypothetical protein